MPHGEHMKEFVQMYVDSLKEVGNTREDLPSLEYKTMFLKFDELDLSIYDDETECLLEKIYRQGRL